MSIKFPIEAGQIMLFARAIGDPNPIYSDATYAASTEPSAVIAPPTFVQSSAQYDPDYFLRPAIGGDNWFGSGANPTGKTASKEGDNKEDDKESENNTGGTLHAEQHYHYHRHPQAGDLLTAEHIQGKTWSKEGRRGGTLHFSEAITEYRDQNGELVVTARSIGVRTSKVVE